MAIRVRPSIDHHREDDLAGPEIVRGVIWFRG
jgi:hypothetical protein